MPTALLIWRNRALGDTILALPALRAVQALRPSLDLRLLGYPDAWRWLGRRAPVVATIEEPPFDTLLAGRSSAELRAALQGVAAALVLTVSRNLLPALARAGVLHASQASPRPPAGLHAADWLRAVVLAALAGDLPPDVAAGNPAIPRLRLTPRELVRARGLLAALGVAEPQRPVFIHPGAGNDWECWPVERFGRLAAALLGWGCQIVLIEGFLDALRIAELQHLLPAPLPVIRGLSPRQLAAVLAAGRCYVGNDSGVTHLAAASGVPTLAIFGPTDPTCWGPRGARVRILRACDRRTTVHDQVRVCDDPACLAGISVEAVLAALRDLPQAPPARPVGSPSGHRHAALAVSPAPVATSAAASGWPGGVPGGAR